MLALAFDLLKNGCCGAAAGIKGENKKEKNVAVLATAELPAKSVDLAAINLTELVNGMLNTALKDFTALLVDIIGNSTSYLTEIFKSTSIVSVSQSNDSDCIYICVMAGRIGRNMSDFWEMIEKSPVINYTFSSNMSALLATRMPSWEQTVAWKGDEILSTRFPTWPKTVGLKGSGFPILQLPLWLQTDASKGHGTTRPSPTTMESDDILPQIQPSRCPQATLKEPPMNSPPVTFMAQKINPCVMELCKFFQQCLCVNQRRNSRKEAMR
ncbi:HERV-H LTR-associating protein 1 [Chelonia mydas]|uniref:HERV-H LTR-associating protein 1 n=1 Tax=Chelonia mydas TaxID=8469 RepID=M7AUK6_CHEMY|nr:HERV-H LTR-associating protein 1 [Chelonia mydas]